MTSSLPLGRNAWPSAYLARWTGTALGATCSITISGETPERAHATIVSAITEIKRMEALFSLYREDSELMRLNRAGRLDNSSPDMMRLLGICDTVHRLTGGGFDPTIQPVWRLLAERRGHAGAKAMKAARDLVGWRYVRLRNRSVVFSKAGMALTLNGIAQGYATDRVTDVLKSLGIENVLVDIGEIAAVGTRGPTLPWTIGIAERGDAAPEREIELTDKAIATSSPHATVFDQAGAVGHIVDPSGRFSPPRWRWISVIHRSAAVADGLSTGFCLLSREEIDVAARASDAKVEFP